jgi:hypothetical protein
MLARIGDPRLELCARGHGASRVVREAEVNDVDVLLRRFGDEVVFRRAVQIHEPGVGAAVAGFAGVPGHDVRVDIHGIYRVRDGDLVLAPEDIEDVAAIALRTVAHEDFVVRDFEALRAIVVLRDGVAEPLVTLLGPVAVEAFARGHVVHGLVHRRGDGSGQGFGHVADAAADDALGGFRIRFAEDLHAPRDLGEKITGLELEIVVVEESHRSGAGRCSAPLPRAQWGITCDPASTGRN